MWHNKDKYWSKWKTRTVINRVNSANPSEGDLRILLNHARIPTSFAYVLTWNGVTYKTFKEAAERRGLRQSEEWIYDCLFEASSF